jgi:hypothetical protein
MSVTLFEPSLRFLLEDQDGPVGIDLRRRAEIITRLVEQNAQHIIIQMPDGIVGYEISNGDLGLQAEIGLTGSGRWSNYLASKEIREGVVFRPALDQGLEQ